MENNKGQTIFLSVIGIATLLVAIIGATFAYFTTTMTGTAGTVSATTARVGGLTYVAESAVVTDKIYPGWSTTPKNVAVELTDTTEQAISWKCTYKATSSVTDLFIQTAETGTSYGKFSAKTALVTDGTETLLAEGTFAANSTKGTKHSFTYEVFFKETGESQNGTNNANMSQPINVDVKCELANGQVYYTHGNETGTTTKPGSQW